MKINVDERTCLTSHIEVNVLDYFIYRIGRMAIYSPDKIRDIITKHSKGVD